MTILSSYRQEKNLTNNEKMKSNHAIDMVVLEKNEPQVKLSHIYRKRDLAERFFNQLKQSRKTATRYGKLNYSFMVFIFSIEAAG